MQPKKAPKTEAQTIAFKRFDLWNTKGVFSAITELRKIHLPAKIGAVIEYIYDQMLQHRQAIDEARVKLLDEYKITVDEDSGEVSYPDDDTKVKVDGLFRQLMDQPVNIANPPILWKDIQDSMIPPEVLMFLKPIITGYPEF